MKNVLKWKWNVFSKKFKKINKLIKRVNEDNKIMIQSWIVYHSAGLSTFTVVTCGIARMGVQLEFFSPQRPPCKKKKKSSANQLTGHHQREAGFITNTCHELYLYRACLCTFWLPGASWCATLVLDAWWDSILVSKLDQLHRNKCKEST